MDSKDTIRAERRKAKFSEESRHRILNDPLKDRSLLSRSDRTSEPDTLTSLRNNHRSRQELLARIKLRCGKDSKDELIGHGLRKLREVLVSIFESEKHDRIFLSFAREVHELSIEYYLNLAVIDWARLNNSLEFITSRLAADFPCEEYLAAFILYEALESRSYSRSVYKLHHQFQASSFSVAYHDACLHIIQSCATENYHQWFDALNKLSENSFLFKFLIKLPFHQQAIKKTMETIAHSYRQVSTAFISKFWYRSFDVDLEAIVASKYTSTRVSADASVIVFKTK